MIPMFGRYLVPRLVPAQSVQDPPTISLTTRGLTSYIHCVYDDLNVLQGFVLGLKTFENKY
eukprot:UN08310